MNTYVVTSKDTGQVVYEYQSDAPVEWHGMEFSTHDHSLAPVINEDGSIEGVFKRRLTKLEFIEKLGDTAFAAILEMTKTSPEVNAWVEKVRLTTPDPDGTSVDLKDLRTVAGVEAIGQVLESQGIVQAGWANEVLNG